MDTAMLDQTYQTVQVCGFDPCTTGNSDSRCSTPLTSTRRSFPLVSELSPSLLQMTEDDQGSSDVCNPQLAIIAKYDFPIVETSIVVVTMHKNLE